MRGRLWLGKTVPSYRMAIEDEISSWKAFVNSLCEKDRAAFEVLMDPAEATQWRLGVS